MNGPQDMGGLQGFGPVIREENEPWFHDEWERRAFALTLAMAKPGGWNIDMSRHSRETLPPAEYVTSSYYQIWFAALQRLIVEKGLVSKDEITTGVSCRPALAGKPVLKAADVAGVLSRGGPVERDPSTLPDFAVGDKIRVLNRHPLHHTRCPRYVRGHIGEIARIHGCHVFPDTNASGEGEHPQWLYSVRFSARELWGDQANPADHVHADLWESYFEHG